MESFVKILVLVNILVLVLAGSETSKDLPSNSAQSGRTGRKNYGVYRPTKDYGDDGDDKDDTNDDSEPSPPNPRPPQGSGNDYPNFNSYKGFDQFNSYDPPARYPQFAPNYKGYPFYAPYWKGAAKPGDSSPASPASPAQMMEMMMAMNNMGDDAKPEDTGILSKLVSDPKSVAAAAIIPLSIVLAATVPVFMNYMMTGAPTPLVSTTATGSKEGRNLDGGNNLDLVLDNIVRFARALDSDDCIQKTICKAAHGDANVPGSDYFKKAATAVAHLVKEDWVDNLGVKHLMDGLKQGNCADVCSGNNVRPRER